jgi:hypothetical protein
MGCAESLFVRYQLVIWQLWDCPVMIALDVGYTAWPPGRQGNRIRIAKAEQEKTASLLLFGLLDVIDTYG